MRCVVLSAVGLVAVVATACGEPVAASAPGVIAAESPAEAPAPDVGVAGGDLHGLLEGDPDATERELLDLRHAELSDDVLLSLPGSRGIAVQDSAAPIPEGGLSVGTPQRGSLRSGVRLPFNPALYTRRDPARSFGSTHTIRTIHSAFTALRQQRGVHAQVIIGDISRPRGGRFRPHVSHQSGRDIDIRLVLAPGLDPRTLPVDAASVDWDATWALVHSFLETGHVRYVFLSHQRQANLHAAGVRAGVLPGVLDRWFQWPGADPTSLIRHEDGHRAHIHIRLRCGPLDHGCRGS